VAGQAESAPQVASKNKPAQVKAFVERFTETLHQAMPSKQNPLEPRPVRVFAEDESRFGLLPIQRRRMTLKGIQPIASVQYDFESFYLYAAVEPTTGERFILELPAINTLNFQIFLDEFSKAYSASFNLVVLDNGRFHKAQQLSIPEKIGLVFFPPYAPELNPTERLWRDMTDRVAQSNPTSLDELSDIVMAIIEQYSTEDIRSLTSYAYFIHAVNG